MGGLTSREFPSYNGLSRRVRRSSAPRFKPAYSSAWNGRFIVYEVAVEMAFAAAHNLRGYEGECEKLHGHNYRVQVVLAGEGLNGLEMLVDFREVKDLVGEVVDRLDHGYLNELAPFDEVNPSAEQVARHIADALNGRAPGGVRVQRVTCWESEKCAATYIPGGASPER